VGAELRFVNPSRYETVAFALPSSRRVRARIVATLLFVATAADASGEHVFDIPAQSVRTLRDLLVLEVPHGTLHIEKSHDDRLHVGGTKVISATDREHAERLAESTGVDVFEDELACHVRVDIPGPAKRGFWDWMFGSRESVGVDLRVAVPAKAGLRIRTTSAHVFASGVSGAVQVQSINGDVHLLDVGSGVRVEVARGRVHVEDAHGSVAVEGASANVTLRGISGDCTVDLEEGDLEAADLRRNIQVQTQSGDIQLHDLRGNLRLVTTSGNAILRNVRGDVRTQLTHGHLDVEFEPRLGRYYEMTSRTGDLSVRLLGLAPFQLHARAPNGELEGSIPGMTYEQHTRHEVRGRMEESGGPHVHLRSDEGDVHVCCPARERSHGCPGPRSRS
jgi:hypothetical protein